MGVFYHMNKKTSNEIEEKAIMELKKVQLAPLEHFKIPIDDVTHRTFYNYISAGEEILERKEVPVIPEGTTADTLIKQGLKKFSSTNHWRFRDFDKLTIKPADSTITENDIINIGVAHKMFGISETNYYEQKDGYMEKLNVYEYCSLSYAEQEKLIKEEIAVVPNKINVSDVIKDGIKRGIKEFEEMAIVTDKTDDEILNMAVYAELLKTETVYEHTGKFSTARRGKAFYDSRKRGLISSITYSKENASSGTELKEFDYAVLSACHTEILHGNRYTTVTRLFHILGGGHVLTPNIRQDILDSLSKLATVRVKISLDKDTIKKNVIEKGEQYRFKNREFEGYILPFERLTVSLNGQIVDVIHFLDGGAILNNSQARKQIISCDPNLLNAPIKKTKNNIAINHYLLRRVFEIIGSNSPEHKHGAKLRNIITFEHLYSRVGAETKLDQQRARAVAIKILDFFVEKGLIKSYQIVKKEKKIYSIEIQF